VGDEHGAGTVGADEIGAAVTVDIAEPQIAVRPLRNRTRRRKATIRKPADKQRPVRPADDDIRKAVETRTEPYVARRDRVADHDRWPEAAVGPRRRRHRRRRCAGDEHQECGDDHQASRTDDRHAVVNRAGARLQQVVHDGAQRLRA
jgi:hypothetical protein